MTDYGHEPAFGTFVTPDAAHPERVLELAALTEVSGLDLLTVQDHPYQARFLDVWAVLASVLARTTTLRVAPNVVNLPLRPPHVLARTVASLDLLSRGRVELGLGAGAFWDAIVASGGPRRTPAQALAATEEAVRVLRATWEPDGATVRVDGEHYRVHGVHAGPAPAHPVEIWLGALGPRMLALTGRVADGWLPSMSYVPPEGLAERNARIDDAALAAGRDPAAVRRLYNVNPAPGPGQPGLVGAPTAWAEQLAALCLEHGMSTFVLATDDPRLVRVFGDEVAPATRELVDAARRGSGGSTEPGPGAVPPTPEDGRPVYVSPGPPLAWTAQERAGAQHLVDVHDHLRAELAQLHGLIDQVGAGAVDAGAARSAINEMTLRQNSWTLGAYCASYCRVLTTHHTIEDTSMFPHLREREPGLRPVVDRLEVEHHQIAGMLEAVDRALVAMVAGPGGTAGLRDAVRDLDRTLSSHLAWEESVLAEPLARHGFF